MMKKLSALPIKYFVFLILIIGLLTRTYDLNWGAPFYFHPDERNIASLLMQDALADFPSYFYKGSFSYGNFLTIILQLPKILLDTINPNTDLFALSTLITRYASAFFSVSTLVVIYKAGTIFSKKVGLIALILGAFSTGLIQNSHFGTFDTFVTFAILLAFYLSLLLITTTQLKYFYIACLSLVLATSVKITSIVFLSIVLLAYLFAMKKKNLKKLVLYPLFGLLLFAIVPVLSPYYITSDFMNLLQYERGVVSGSLPVFYTQTFFNKIPILFQFTNIYPFLINPFLTLLVPLSFFSSCILFLRKKDKKILLVILSLLVLFVPQSFLFAKWSRYMIPTLPFIYLIIAIFLSSLLSSKFIPKKISISIISLLVVISINYSFSFIKTVYINQDTRIEAANWAENNIESNSVILSEIYDLGIVPFNSNFHDITLFNFYDLEENPILQRELNETIEKYDYFILPSQRILSSRMSLSQEFPKGHQFYGSLFEEKGFEKVYETPCDIFCRIVYLNDPIYIFEQTSYVFDRPHILIFKAKK